MMCCDDVMRKGGGGSSLVCVCVCACVVDCLSMDVCVEEILFFSSPLSLSLPLSLLLFSQMIHHYIGFPAAVAAVLLCDFVSSIF